MDRNIPHDIVECTLQDYVIEKQGGQDSNLEMISFIDFIAIMVCLLNIRISVGNGANHFIVIEYDY